MKKVLEFTETVEKRWCRGWRRVLGVIHARRAAAEVKTNVLKTIVRPTLSVARRREAGIEVAQIRILRLSLRVTG